MKSPDSPSPTPPSPQSDPARDKFLDQVIAEVRKKFPLVHLARSLAPFSLRINDQVVSLENLFRTVSLDPEQAAHHIDRWMVEMLRAGEGMPDAGAGFEEVRERILPMLISDHEGQPKRGPIVSQPLVPGMHVSYALDQDRTIAYVHKALFDHWAISLDQLHETALENLLTRSQELAAHAAADEDGTVNLIVFQTMDGYDASRLLLPGLHDRLREHLGSPFAAAVPNRDILLCFRNSPEMVEKLTSQIAADYAAMPHQISDRLFLVTADGIALRTEE